MPNALDVTTITPSSGNVFADIGVPDPELAAQKAEIALQIQDKIRSLGLTQAAAGRLMGIPQSKVSPIVRGLLRDFSLERLVVMLGKLGRQTRFTFVDVPIRKAGTDPIPVRRARTKTPKKGTRKVNPFSSSEKRAKAPAAE